MSKNAFPEWFDKPHLKVEKEIISRAVTGILNAGCSISIFDEEGWVVKQSTDREEITSNVGQSDYTGFRIRRNGEYVGFVDFIHGNGADVLSDYTYSTEVEEMLKKANEYAERQW